MSPPETPLLEAHEVTKRFEGITALDAVSLTVQPGELVALIGPNGAGKTTFFNCLLGVLRPEVGEMHFGGADLTRLLAYQRARLGLARTFQRIELFAGMTVREHLIVAARAHRVRGGLLRDLLGRSGPTAVELADSADTLDLLGITELADRPVESLSLGKGRVVELARALMCRPRLLFLDEPSSGLDVHETADMGDVLLRVQRERGTAILLVEHDVPLVERLAQRTYVLDSGLLIADGPTAEVLADPDVRTAYLGVSA